MKNIEITRIFQNNNAQLLIDIFTDSLPNKYRVTKSELKYMRPNLGNDVFAGRQVSKLEEKISQII